MNPMTRWTLAVLERDQYTCQVAGCGANTNLDAAHIIPRTCRALRFDPDNGVALCRTHHQWFHSHPQQFYMFAATLGPRYARLQHQYARSLPLLTPG